MEEVLLTFNVQFSFEKETMAAEEEKFWWYFHNFTSFVEKVVQKFGRNFTEPDPNVLFKNNTTPKPN